MSGKKNNDPTVWIVIVGVIVTVFTVFGVGTTGTTPVVTSVPSAPPPTKPVAARPISATEIPPAPAPASVPVPAPRPVMTEERLKAMMMAQVERSHVEMPLRIAEHRAGLQLTDEQHQRLVNDVLDFEHVRAQTEKALVNVKSFDGTTLALQIPAYPDQGNVLKAAFANQVSGEFPLAVAAAIEGALSGPLSTVFGGFGKFSQEDVVTTTDSGEIHVRVRAGVSGDVKMADDATLAQAQQLSGDGSFSRDALPIFHEAIADVVFAHFPAK